MPRAKIFDKKTSTKYALVNRPQHDPLIHDPDAPQQVFTKISEPAAGAAASSSSTSSQRERKSKVKQRGDLEDEFGLSEQIRANEGEAAEHGVYFDDSKYDYMQHLRDLGGSSDATFIDAAKPRAKDKGKQKLEDALSELTVQSDGDTENASLVELDASARYKKQTYQDQQDIPDALRGFQPDMDPRLREVLEALEDEEYVDDDEDVFSKLTGEGGGGAEYHEGDEYYYDDEEEEGWESDETEKPQAEYKDTILPTHTSTHLSSNIPSDLSTDSPLNSSEEPPLDPSEHPTIPHTAKEDGDWFANFAKNKPTSQSNQLPQLKQANIAASTIDSSASMFGKRKKRKGALTSSTGFSMTSSALARTETLSTLDERFERIAESYMEDVDEGDEDEGASVVSGMSNMTGMSRMSGMSSRTDASRFSAFGGSQASQAPELVPAGFHSVLDDFLTDSNSRNRKVKSKGGSSRWAGQSGMQQLDEVRRGLGPARVKN